MSKNRDFSKLVRSIVDNTDIDSGIMVRKNEQLLTANLTIATDENALMIGPIDLANNVSITVQGNLSVV